MKAKLISSIPNGDGWRAYARRAARYGAQLRALGLGADDAERMRARQAYQRGIERARRESWQCCAVRRIIRILDKKRAPVAVGLLGGERQ